MKPETWKTIAIIFIVLFILETAWICLGWYILITEENKTNECYYNVCSDYPEATYESGVCTCYDYDLMGEFIPVKTQLIK